VHQQTDCGSQPLTHESNKPESLQGTNPTAQHVITIIDETPTHQKIPKWLTVNHINLYQSDKDAITGNEWLNDQHMCVAQNLIKQQYPHIHGLMPTVLQGRNPLPQDSLQILHTDGEYWVAVSTFDTGDEDIVIYDSKYSSLSQSTQAVLAKLVNTDKPSFNVKVYSKCDEAVRGFGLWTVCYRIHSTHCQQARSIHVYI
jgi:hypothetical protein